jgi:putative transport protein
LFAGAFTNTPALAGLLETIQSRASAASLEGLLAEPVVAYSVAYPMGVVAMLVSIALLERLWKIDYALEAKRVPNVAGTGEGLTHQSVVVTSEEFRDEPISHVAHARGWNVVLGRYQHAGAVSLIGPETKLEPGDVVSVIGHSNVVRDVTRAIGEPSSEALEADRRTMDFRRVVVSNPTVAGKKLAQLQLPQQFGALVTRVGRGDVDLLPSGETVLELGDRVRVVSPAGRMNEISNLFGDSYRAIAEIDVMTFGIGIALGLLIGSVPIPLPGGTSFKLGFAGGPLIVGLILGALGRTGPVLWQLPHGANLTLRQLGLILFLAGVGTRSGYAFASTLSSGGGLTLFLAGLTLTTVTAMATLWIGYRRLQIPFPLLTGLLAGLQTQPAVLGFASERAGNDLPNVGYATVYPVATIAKIVIAQVLLTLLS